MQLKQAECFKSQFELLEQTEDEGRGGDNEEDEKHEIGSS